jgi:hypothetical protein
MLTLRAFAAGIAAALICTVDAPAQPASDKPSASHLTDKKASNQAPSSASGQSSKIWSNSDKLSSEQLTGPGRAVSPPKKTLNTSKQVRPDALGYSYKVWPDIYWLIGSSATADTPHGKLQCMSVGGGRRVCSWQ